MSHIVNGINKDYLIKELPICSLTKTQKTDI